MAEVAEPVSLRGSSAQARRAADAVIAGRRRGPLALLPFLGPAVIASVAYMDPGNFATNIQSGASFGYRLLWVVLFANVVAMLFQGLSAKLGIVTGRNLAELCREHFPHSLVIFYWIISEVAAMATDLAEFLGATIGFNLLFGMPLGVGVVVTAVLTYAILLLERRGFRPIEIVIGALVGVMALSYLIELAMAHPAWREIGQGLVVPWIGGSDSLFVAVGIVGATVMPHAIYLHSYLTQGRVLARSPHEKRAIMTWSNREVVIALTLAGLVNIAMMVMAASVFHDGVHEDVASIETAYATLTPLLGRAAAGVFLISLFASGISSSVVGTMAGQVIMQGFVGWRLPLWVRRLITMLPAVIAIIAGLDATRVLIVSQVVLSFALPLPLVALMIFTSRRSLMGELVNRRMTQIAGTLATVAIVALNLVLLAEMLVSG
ncbi:MAG: Nramp family divalent metal transporter [Hyphomicrobiales bacterium]|nr:Nramp family divalent metal transporter [Hyphomicrobiales bacterium]